MAAILPDSVTAGQPHSVQLSVYRMRLMRPAKIVIAENVAKLLAKRRGEPWAPEASYTADLIKLGVKNGNAQRILSSETNAGFFVSDRQALRRNFYRKRLTTTYRIRYSLPSAPIDAGRSR